MMSNWKYQALSFPLMSERHPLALMDSSVVFKRVPEVLSILCSHRGWLLAFLAILMLTTASPVLYAAEGGYQRSVDIIDATYLSEPNSVLVVGHFGLIGLLSPQDQQATLQQLSSDSGKDFTAVAADSATTALVGGSRGVIYRYDNGQLSKEAALSTFNEPILDITVADGVAWACGGRGLLARRDATSPQWQTVEVMKVLQPPLLIPSLSPGTWYSGVANIDMDSFQITATVAGKPAEIDVDYSVYAEDGMVIIHNALDANPAPSVSFFFTPGAPFGGGDVTWNVVLANNGQTTLAGEFGLILQSKDQGKSWVRRSGKLSAKEPEQPYWLSGDVNGQRIALAGAAGIVAISEDQGEQWQRLPDPSKEGIFGISLFTEKSPMIAGAAGLVGHYETSSWQLIDRSKLALLSWSRTFVETKGDNGLLLLGGRSTVLRYQRDDGWQRLLLKIEGEQP